MFTKQLIKDSWQNHRAKAIEAGQDPDKASLALATQISISAHFGDTLRSGEDYISHPQHISAQFESKTLRIISILHDAIEDSDWTLDELKELGFSDRIIKGIDGVTKRPGERYFDFIVRCGKSGQDAIDVKIQDLKHNSDNTRYPNITETSKQSRKRHVYNIAFNYLIDIKKIRDKGGNYNQPGTSIIDYIRSRDAFSKAPITINSLLEEHSTETARLPTPKLVQAAANAFGWRRVQTARNIGYAAQEFVYG